MIGESDLIPVLWLSEMANLGVTELGHELKSDFGLRNFLNHQAFLVQRVFRAGFDSDFIWVHPHGVLSQSLEGTFGLIMDPVYRGELTESMANRPLGEAAKKLVSDSRSLITPHENWTGDCERVWVKGESALLYQSEMLSLEPFETFKERTINAVLAYLPGIPKPLAVAAFERLNELDAFAASRKATD